MGIIKKSKIVDQAVYGDTTSDPFRVLAKTHWHNKTDPEGVETNRLVFGGSTANKKRDDSMIKRIEVEDVSIDTGPFFCEFTSRVRIIGDENQIDSDTIWNDLITDNVITGMPYYDHAFDIDIPYTEFESEEVSATAHTSVAKTKMFYNYFHAQYERTIQNEIYEETILPNMYAFLSIATPRDAIGTNPAFKDLITLNSTLPETFLYALSQTATEKGLTAFTDRTGYLTRYGLEGASEFIADERAAASLSQRFSHILVPYEKVGVIAHFEDYKDYFPMYTEIEFQTDINTNIADAFQNSGIGCLFMKEMFETLFEIGGSMDLTEGTFVNHYQFPSVTTDDEGNYFYEQNESISSSTVRYIDLQNWIESTYSQETTSIGSQGVYIGDYSTNVKTAMSNEFPFYRNFIYILLTGYIRNLIQGTDDVGMRMFTDLMGGELAYSETLMYRVSKYAGTVDATDLETEPIQTFWLPNSSDIDILNFIDTQVKYGEDYTYTIYAYQAVMGTEYEYSNIAISKMISQFPKVCLELVDIASGEMIESAFESSPRLYQAAELEGITNTYMSNNGTRYFAEFDVTYKPSFKIVEVPIFSFSGKLIDNPPLVPDVDFIPYFGISDKIRIFLSGRVGTEEAEEITFNAEDRLIFKAIREAQGLQPFEEITFRSDDYPYQYEVYRTKVPPKSYQDFNGTLLARVDTAHSSLDDPKYSIAIDYEDKILTNTKYYYTFRAVDLHGKISNPTAIYKFEMVDDGASVYPTVEEYKIQQPVVTRLFKAADRFAYIVPKLEHRLINEEASGFEEAESLLGIGKDVHMGSADDAVWDNKFKIRLTSRKTGRKIDLNLQFETKHIVTTSEQN